MFQTIVVVFAAFILAYILALAVLRNKNKKFSLDNQSVKLDKMFVQNKWTEIEQTFSLGGPNHFKTSIMEADKLVDYVLKSKRIKGETFGERLKNAKSRFSNYSDYNNLWFAHKVRNNIAHETTHDLNSAEAKRAMEYYKKALKELGTM
ncbi:MAG: hypothetical protein WC437_01265 [Patescibacteria group bacterium]|jgi:hypothetical protein|nr:hypothetical protein [Patescibacteria group bacterium]